MPALYSANHENQGNHKGLPLQNQFLAATFTATEQLLSVEDTLSTIGFQMPITALRPKAGILNSRR
ncbi:MAG: hypothetical protein C4560_04485 [Nitrospiraceae bacterium]|nr:MAG: hypothetical protein C4560_04485 [Nitrospiraceae bacterium]